MPGHCSALWKSCQRPGSRDQRVLTHHWLDKLAPKAKDASKLHNMMFMHHCTQGSALALALGVPLRHRPQTEEALPLETGGMFPTSPLAWLSYNWGAAELTAVRTPEIQSHTAVIHSPSACVAATWPAHLPRDFVHNFVLSPTGTCAAAVSPAQWPRGIEYSIGRQMFWAPNFSAMLHSDYARH